MSQWTQEDVDRLNAKRGATMPAHVGVRPGSPLQAGAGQTGATMSVTGKRSKYRNVKTMVGGERFDSKREADYWLMLKAREQLGEICDLQRQVRFPLVCYTDTYETLQVAEYVADFVYHDVRTESVAYHDVRQEMRHAGQKHVVDAKGHRTQMYRLKAKWLELQTGIVIEEV